MAITIGDLAERALVFIVMARIVMARRVPAMTKRQRMRLAYGVIDPWVLTYSA
jgi:hypothetical protein